MRAVIDTNVLVSGLIWRGPPHAGLECVRTGSISIANAVWHATGVRVRRFPIQIEDLLGPIR